MSRVRFVMIGGFLGAGKTTTIGRLARAYVERGQRVGLVTNDQAADLVDTHNLRSQGFAVEEVPGSCFCCAFNQLADALGRLASVERPDVLLSEPVGSCTDLVATVVQPLKRLYADRYVLTPLVVLVDPHRARKILSRAPRGGFSPKAAYIYEKQLQEADAIAINKIDSLSPTERDEVAGLLGERFPQTPLVAISARTGDGFDELGRLLDHGDVARVGRNIPHVDYDIYADGEAELGWLNTALSLSAVAPFDLDDLLLRLLVQVQRRLNAIDADAAHLKVIGSAGGAQAVANLVRSDGRPELSRRSAHRTTGAELIVNARAFLDPAELNRIVEDSVRGVCADSGIEPSITAARHFRPARPTPTYRYAEAL